MSASFYHNIKKFIRDIQRSDEARRKKWFIGGSVVSVFFVLLLWGVYVSIDFPKIEPPISEVQKNAQIEEKKTNESIFDVFGRGIKNISNDFKKQYNTFRMYVEKSFGSLKGGVQEKNIMYIQGARINFVFDNLDPIPPTHLP
ncbi:MAG: hypothetical protein AB1333_00870 [Patescibacteria group bacterium]